MRHIKTYENVLEYKEYEIGDYIILKEDEFKWQVETSVKIVSKFIPEKYIGKKREYSYSIETYDINNGDPKNFWVNLYEIERKMTTEEIKDYKIHLSTKKYNL